MSIVPPSSSLSLPPSLSLPLSLSLSCMSFSLCGRFKSTDGQSQGRASACLSLSYGWVHLPIVIELLSWVQSTDGGETRLALGDITSVMGKQYDIISCVHHVTMAMAFGNFGKVDTSIDFLPHSLSIQSSVPHSCSELFGRATCVYVKLWELGVDAWKGMYHMTGVLATLGLLRLHTSSFFLRIMQACRVCLQSGRVCGKGMCNPPPACTTVYPLHLVGGLTTCTGYWCRYYIPNWPRLSYYSRYVSCHRTAVIGCC